MFLSCCQNSDSNSSSAMLQIELKHGTTKYPLEVSPDYQLCDLKEEAQRLTGVPVAQQKLILNGQTLVADPDYENKTLKEYSLRNGSRVMILGKRFDASKDPNLADILQIEKSVNALEKDFGIIRGQIIQASSGKGINVDPKYLNKESKAYSEQLMRLIEELDSIKLEPHQAEAKAKRKAVATCINVKLDEVESLFEKINQIQ
ncbi:BAG family molecular chaperone regulator 1 isoform X2 [Lepeophtheirus salmonis]|uniref:BAG family molecular chaperone regulator 1 n=1 Tax=Lepeophtheirus salmonis TaxID=72036 RepID=A0A0K2T150_LEPSM|nr:uncharacterized protein LOC121122716 isoform X2 [Lepeophtheirus salmonis]